MVRRIVVGIVSAACLIGLAAFQPSPFKRGQRIFILAAKESRLFTMLPSTEEVKLVSGRAWKADGSALVDFPWDHAMHVRLTADHSSLILPLPASGTGRGVATARPVAGRSELDRVAPDPSVKARIEKEFLKRREYVLADSPANADYVFLAESTYLPMQISQLNMPNAVGFRPRGDYKADFLQTVFGIVIPSSEYHPDAVEASALLRARLWEGSVTWRQTRLSGGMEIAPASPESLVAQFHNKERRPAGHFPLCAATSEMSTVGPGPGNRNAIPGLKVNAAVPPLPTSPDRRTGNAITAEVAMVTIPVKVTDQAGRYIPDLKGTEFHVFEDGREQKIDPSSRNPSPGMLPS